MVHAQPYKQTLKVISEPLEWSALSLKRSRNCFSGEKLEIAAFMKYCEMGQLHKILYLFIVRLVCRIEMFVIVG